MPQTLFDGQPTTYSDKVHPDHGESARSDPNGFLSRTLDQPSRSPLHPLWTTSNFRAATNATKALKKRPSAARKRIMNTGSPQLTDLGVYRIDHEDRNPTFLVALKNADEGDYSFALAPAVAIPSAGFTYNDSEILSFLSTDPKDRIYTTYDDSEGLYDQPPASDLSKTGFLAITPDGLLNDTP